MNNFVCHEKSNKFSRPKLSVNIARSNKFNKSNTRLYQPIGNGSQVKQLVITGQAIIISEPGDYILPSDFVFNAEAEDAAAISIEADDVTLNLNGHTISQTDTSFENFNLVIGVEIKPFKNNIKIFNGTIKQISGFGILFDNNSDVANLVQHNNIVLEKLVVQNIGKFTENDLVQDNAGIQINNAQNVNIFDYRINNIAASNIASGIYIISSNNINIKNAKISHVTVDPNGLAMYGMRIMKCQNIKIKNFEITDFSVSNGLSIIYQQLIGIYLVETDIVSVKNGTIKNNYANRFGGVIIQNARVWEKLPVNPNLSIVENVIVENNKSETIMQGMYLFNRVNYLFKNIIIRNNVLARRPDNFLRYEYYYMIGLDILSSHNVRVEDCVCTNNFIETSKPPGTIYSVCAGFGINPAPQSSPIQFFKLQGSNISCRNCLSVKNTPKPGVTGVDLISGWTIFGTDDVKLLKCVGSCQFSDDPDSEVYGFSIGNWPYFPNEVNNIELVCCQAKCNINVTNEDNSGPIAVGNVNPVGTVNNLILIDNCFY